MSVLTWKKMVEIEPELKSLLVEARKCESEFGWALIKAKLRKLVGVYATKEELATIKAYDLAYRKLLNAWGG
jgi:hypothetical protein